MVRYPVRFWSGEHGDLLIERPDEWELSIEFLAGTTPHSACDDSGRHFRAIVWDVKLLLLSLVTAPFKPAELSYLVSGAGGDDYTVYEVYEGEVARTVHLGIASGSAEAGTDQPNDERLWRVPAPDVTSQFDAVWIRTHFGRLSAREVRRLRRSIETSAQLRHRG